MTRIWGTSIAADHLALSPAGDILLAVSSEGVRLLHPATGNLVGGFELSGWRIGEQVLQQGVQFSESGGQFLIWTPVAAGIWNTSDLSPIWVESPSTFLCNSEARLSPCGQFVALHGADPRPKGPFPGRQPHQTRVRLGGPQGGAEHYLPISSLTRGLAFWRGGCALACEDGLWWMPPEGPLERLRRGCCLDVAERQDQLWVLEVSRLYLYPDGPSFACGPGLANIHPIIATGGVFVTSRPNALPQGRIWLLPDLQAGAVEIPYRKAGVSLTPSASRIAIHGPFRQPDTPSEEPGSRRSYGPPPSRHKSAYVEYPGIHIYDARTGAFEQAQPLSGHFGPTGSARSNPVFLWRSEKELFLGGNEVALWEI